MVPVATHVYLLARVRQVQKVYTEANFRFNVFEMQIEHMEKHKFIIPRGSDRLSMDGGMMLRQFVELPKRDDDIWGLSYKECQQLDGILDELETILQNLQIETKQKYEEMREAFNKQYTEKMTAKTQAEISAYLRSELWS